MDEPKTEQFLFRFEFDNEELQEILHKMEQSMNTISNCVSQLEQLGIAKVQRKETAHRAAGQQKCGNTMVNVDPSVGEVELLIECNPNQETEIPLEHILRKARWYKQKYPNAKISIKLVNDQRN